MNRPFKLLVISFFLLLLVATPAPASSESALTPQRAVSLRVLQEQVALCQPKGSCSDDLLHLAGLTWIDGYVIDPHSHDIVLLGRVDSTAPHLWLEDFVMALRVARQMYGHWEGKTWVTAVPGCSIDPQPRVMKALDEIGRLIRQLPPPISEETLQPWHQVCHAPQVVRVFGLPHNTHFAKVMVDADYFMKRLVDGTVTIAGFSSLSELHFRGVERAMAQGRSAIPTLNSMNRFWFMAKPALVSVDQGIALLTQIDVQLCTEEEFLRGKQVRKVPTSVANAITRSECRPDTDHRANMDALVGAGRPDPLAEEWALTFTSQYKTIAQRYPIYRELHNLYRFVGLAKTLDLRQAEHDAGLDLTGLRRNFQVPETSVPETLPGHSNIRTKEYQHATLMMPSCGGVNVDVTVQKKNLNSLPGGMGKTMIHNVLGARPHAQALYWEF